MTVVCWHFMFALQRDLDFSVDIDFRGELSELVQTNHYKMRWASTRYAGATTRDYAVADPRRSSSLASTGSSPVAQLLPTPPPLLQRGMGKGWARERSLPSDGRTLRHASAGVLFHLVSDRVVQRWSKCSVSFLRKFSLRPAASEVGGPVGCTSTNGATRHLDDRCDFTMNIPCSGPMSSRGAARRNWPLHH